MRGRNIKPGFFKNADLVECDPLARILFAGLWCMADKDGRLEDRPKQIKLEILPGDDCNVDSLLDQLHSRNFVSRYEADRRRYIQIGKFKEHQNPHKNEKPSGIPAPVAKQQDKLLDNKDSSNYASAPVIDGTNRADSPFLIPDSIISEAKASSISSRKKKSQSAFVLPDWIPKEPWDAFMEIRVDKKAAQTDYAKKLLVGQLEKLKVRGHDPTFIIENSIKNSWKDLYEPKENGHANNNRSQANIRHSSGTANQQGGIVDSGKSRWAIEADRLIAERRAQSERQGQADAGFVAGV